MTQQNTVTSNSVSTYWDGEDLVVLLDGKTDLRTFLESRFGLDDIESHQLEWESPFSVTIELTIAQRNRAKYVDSKRIAK